MKPVSLTYPRYGVDAPGFVRGFLGTGAVLCIAALLLFQGNGLVVLFGSILLLAAIAPLCLGFSMLLYAAVGKHRLRDHLLRQRAWRGDETVLDIGAGSGLMAIGAAHRVPHGKVLALDIWSTRDLSRNTPDRLRANAALEHVADRIDIVTADARKLDLPDESADVVVSVLCIHNIEPAQARIGACQEIARVLKPGGVALIADFPGAAPYVEPFRAAGLHVAGPVRAERVALGIAGYVVATKP